MGVFKSLITGRKNGIRRTLYQKVFGEAQDTSPDSSFSAPGNDWSEGVAFGGSTKMEPPKDITPPDGFEVVLHREALKPDEVTEIIIAGKAIAMANVNGEYYATKSSCPNCEGPVSEGSVKDHDLSCPYCGWSYDLKTGTGVTNPESSIEVYETRVSGDAVCVKL